MPLDRRSILKALALVPGLPILNSRLAQALMSQGTLSSSYVLLHGMWFMEFDGQGHLLALTPQHQPHHFHIRPQGKPLQDLQKDPLDLTSTLGATGKVQQFPTDILQFSASAINLPSPILPNIAKFRAKLILPLPKLIFAYRTDTTENFPAEAGHVDDSISTFAGPRLGTITCLEYDPGSGGPSVTSYYAEHPRKASSAIVNAALDAVRDPGFLGPNFDLKVKMGFVADACRDTDQSLPTGVLGDDEATIEEIENPLTLFCENNFKANKTIVIHRKSKTGKPAGKQTPRKAAPASKAHRSPHTKSDSDLRLTQGADIASCPQFGINP